MQKQKLIKCLTTNIPLWNRYREWCRYFGEYAVDLRGADLRGADLRGAYLSDAYLSDANLRGADLGGAYLSDADLSDADLGGAYLSDANLRGADLRGADLRGADLSDANLRGADLRGADLRGADLRCADLRGANIDFSSYPLWCGSLGAKLDQRRIIQLLYHAAMPTQNNALGIDDDIQELFNSELFKKVVNKFHRIDGDCKKFEGTKEA
jgi:hypothetical protein